MEKLGQDKLAWAKEINLNGLTVLEKLVEQTAGKYCVGDEITLADVFLIPQLFSANRFGIDVS